MKTKLLFVMMSLCLFLSLASAGITPAWLENNLRHVSYGPLAWAIPGISKFWYVSFMAYAYLALMSNFSRQDKAVQWFNDLVLLYLPMTGIKESGVLA